MRVTYLFLSPKRSLKFRFGLSLPSEVLGSESWSGEPSRVGFFRPKNFMPSTEGIDYAPEYVTSISKNEAWFIANGNSTRDASVMDWWRSSRWRSCHAPDRSKQPVAFHMVWSTAFSFAWFIASSSISRPFAYLSHAGEVEEYLQYGYWKLGKLVFMPAHVDKISTKQAFFFQSIVQSNSDDSRIALGKQESDHNSHI